MERLLAWTSNGLEDFEYWEDNDKRTITKIRKLIKEIKRTPFEGIGKPEPLKGNLSGFWSRRITGEHRLVYAIDSSYITIIQCKGHY